MNQRAVGGPLAQARRWIEADGTLDVCGLQPPGPLVAILEPRRRGPILEGQRLRCLSALLPDYNGGSYAVTLFSSSRKWARASSALS